MRARVEILPVTALRGTAHGVYCTVNGIQYIDERVHDAVIVHDERRSETQTPAEAVLNAVIAGVNLTIKAGARPRSGHDPLQHLMRD